MRQDDGMADERPPVDDVWLLAVHPALTQDLVAWLENRGLRLGRIPGGDAGGDGVWTTSPTDELMESVVLRELLEGGS
jgi:hypothetical protein